MDTNTTTHDRLRRILDYIGTHLDEDLGAAALARRCRLGTGRFTRMFSAAIGVPPHRYVAHKRLEQARRLLLESGLPLAGFP